MTKISQRNRKTRYQTYEEKVAEVHETVVKPVLAKAWPKPKTDHLGILFGVPVFFLAFPFLFAVYFCVCAIKIGRAHV